MMYSGELSSQAVLIYCPSSASDGLIFTAGVSEQFPESSCSTYRHYNESLNGF
jgi:hypothetical protein